MATKVAMRLTSHLKSVPLDRLDSRTYCKITHVSLGCLCFVSSSRGACEDTGLFGTGKWALGSKPAGGR